MPEFEAVYRQYFQFVWKAARRLGIGEDAVDDVVQEVFITVHRKLHTLEHHEALKSWIYGVVRRTASQHRSRSTTGPQRNRDDDATPDSIIGAGPSPLQSAEAQAQVRLLAQILAGMKENKREVFVLVELEEMKVSEVAVALDIPINTAHSRLRLARAEFEAAVQDLRKLEVEGDK